MKNRVRFFIKITVSIGLLALLIKFSGPKQIWACVSESSIPLLLAALALMLLGTFIAAYRWYTVMNILGFRGNVPFYLKGYFKGVFFNQLLPSSIGGDAYRVIDVARLGYKKRVAFVGVLLDRGLGVLGIFIVNIIFNNMLPGLLPQTIYHMLNFISLGGILGFIAFALVHKITFLKKYKLFQIIAFPSENLYLVLNSPLKCIKQLVMTISVHMLTFAGVYLIALSLSQELSMSAFMVIMPPVILLTLIPISLAGWGIREGAMVGLLSFAGISKDISLSISILFGFSFIIQGLIGLYFWIRSDKNKGLENES